MATSQYSILRQYTPYTTPYNIDLIKDVMVYKQGQVDANRARMNQQMDYLMGQQIDKPEAREYMQNKMMGIIDRVNDMYRGADLSSDGITRSIQGEISSVLDSTVMNAIAGSKEGRRMQEYISDLKLNHPELYSPVNEYAAMKPYYEWINDGNAGSRLGSLSYIPYTDYNKEMRTAMDSIMKLHKGQKIQQPVLDKDGNPTGQMMEITRDMMTPQQAASIAMSSLSQNALNQMHMEAAYMADMNPNQFSFNSIMAFNQQSVMDQEDYIRSLEAKLAGAGSDNELAKNIQNELNGAKRDLTEMKKNLASLTPGNYNPAMGAQMVVENTFKQNAANMYSYDNSSITIGKDEVYWASKSLEMQERNYNLQLQKMDLEAKKWEAAFNYKRNKDQAEFAYKQEADAARLQYLKDKDAAKYELEMQKLAKKYSSGMSGRDASISVGTAVSGMSNPYQGTITYNAMVTEDTAISEELNKNDETVYTALKTSGEQLKAALGQQNVDRINSYIKERLKDPTSGYQGLTNEEQMLKYFQDNSGLANEMFDNISDDNARKMATDAFQGLISASARMDIINDRLNEESSVIDEATINYANSIYEKYKDKDNGENLFYSDLLRASLWGAGIGDKNEEGKYMEENGYETPLFSADELSYLNKRVNSVIKYANDKGYNINKVNLLDYAKFDDKNGGFYFDLNKDANDPNIISLLKDNIYNIRKYWRIGLSGREEGAMGAMSSYNRMMKTIDNDLYKNRLAEIRKKYINYQANPTQTYQGDISEKDPRYNIMKGLKSIFEAKTNSSLQSAQSYSYRKTDQVDDSGRPVYEIRVNAPITGDNKEIEPFTVVSESELIANGIPVQQDREWTDIGGYKSGLISPTFSKDTVMWYPKMMEQNGYDPVWATKATALKQVVDVIAEKRFPEDQYSMDGKMIAADPRKTALIGYAKEIMDNYSKFAISVEGYSNYGVGYILSLYDKSGGKPEKIAYIDNPGVAYADEVMKQINIAPQLQFMMILNTYIANEINNIENYSSQDIDPEGGLAKMLKVARGNEGGQDNG